MFFAFLEGCCYGKETSLWFGVVYENSRIAPNGIKLIPVQLIEAIAEFALFFILVYLRKKRMRSVNLLSVYLICYGILRFVLEFFRGDDYRGFVGAISLSQLISIFTIILGILITIIAFYLEKIRR